MPVSAPVVAAPFFAAAEDEILIRKVDEPGGWLSNMSPHPIQYGGQIWWHCEALFQALRFAAEEFEAREEIRQWKSPMRAKMVAKRFKSRHVVVPLSVADVANMRMCLRLKVAQQDVVRRRLLASGARPIVEDCSSRGRRVNNLFWGAVSVADGWEGSNWLGRLWMELRAQLLVDAS